MASPATSSSARRLRPEKREAILAAARREFGRAGFVRARTEDIATEAGVSTRTLYNHFPSKDELFCTVLVEGARLVASAFVAEVAELDPATDPPEDLIAEIGRALVAHRLDFPEHFAISQHVSAEREHLAAGVLERWQEVGPRRVEREIAGMLKGLALRGVLDIDDPDRAAFQLILLTAGAIAFLAPPGTAIAPNDATDIAHAGSRTFLHGTLSRT